MEVTLIKKRKLEKPDVIVSTTGVGTIAWVSKILSFLVFATFVFTGCEIFEGERVEEEVVEIIPTSFFTNQSSSNQTGVVYGENIVVSAGGSGSLTLSGTCNFAEITVQGSGGFSGSNLEIREAEVVSQASGHTYIWVTDRLNVKVLGSGNVYYRGNPQIKSVVQGSGKLIKM